MDRAATQAGQVAPSLIRHMCWKSKLYRWFWLHDWQLACAVVGLAAFARGMVYLTSGTAPLPLLSAPGWIHIPTAAWGVAFVVVGAAQLGAAFTSSTAGARVSCMAAAAVWLMTAHALLTAPAAVSIGASALAGASGFAVMALASGLIYKRARN